MPNSRTNAQLKFYIYIFISPSNGGNIHILFICRMSTFHAVTTCVHVVCNCNYKNNEVIIYRPSEIWLATCSSNQTCLREAATDKSTDNKRLAKTISKLLFFLIFIDSATFVGKLQLNTRSAQRPQTSAKTGH